MVVVASAANIHHFTRLRVAGNLHASHLVSTYQVCAPSCQVVGCSVHFRPKEHFIKIFHCELGTKVRLEWYQWKYSFVDKSIITFNIKSAVKFT